MAIKCLLDGCLGFESNKIFLRNTVDAHSLPDLITVIISRVIVEIAAMAILATWSRFHVNHDVDEVALFWIRPLVNLNEGSIMEIEVQYFQILAQFSVRLQDLTVVIVRDVENTSCIVRRWKTCKNLPVIILDVRRRDPQYMTLHHGASNRAFLCDRQTTRNVRWFVPSLNFQDIALDYPEFPCGVEIVVVSIKTLTVRITIHNACLLMCQAAQRLALPPD